MHRILFYKTKSGETPVLDYIRKLESRSDKDGRIKLHKIQEYINVLRSYGVQAGEPYIKHLDGDIWELRPIRDRILFAAWIDNKFILLHHFLKQTQKTPKKEIDQAKRELADYAERSKKNEQSTEK